MIFFHSASVGWSWWGCMDEWRTMLDFLWRSSVCGSTSTCFLFSRSPDWWFLISSAPCPTSCPTAEDAASTKEVSSVNTVDEADGLQVIQWWMDANFNPLILLLEELHLFRFGRVFCKPPCSVLSADTYGNTWIPMPPESPPSPDTKHISPVAQDIN